MTTSISWAPASTDRRISLTRSVSGDRPAGKPVDTAATCTPLPSSACSAVSTNVWYTQMAATLICSSSIPSLCSNSGWMGCRPFAHNRRTRSSVSSPERVVRSMQVIARRSHAACHSFFTVLRATCDCARRSTALVLTRTSRTQSRLRGMPTFGSRGRPERIAIAPPWSCASRWATLRNTLCSTGIKCSTTNAGFVAAPSVETGLAPSHSAAGDAASRVSTGSSGAGQRHSKFPQFVLCRSIVRQIRRKMNSGFVLTLGLCTATLRRDSDLRRSDVHTPHSGYCTVLDDHERHLLGLVGQHLQGRQELSLRVVLLGLRRRYFSGVADPRVHHGKHGQRRFQFLEQCSFRRHQQHRFRHDRRRHLQSGEPAAGGCD